MLLLWGYNVRYYRGLVRPLEQSNVFQTRDDGGIAPLVQSSLAQEYLLSDP